MKADVTFHVEYDENENHLRISCGNVDGDGLPVPVYMAILKAMLRVEDLLNGEDQLTEPRLLHSNFPITSPGESLEEMGALREDVIEDTIKVECDTPAKFRRIIPDIPPPPVPCYPPQRRKQ